MRNGLLTKKTDREKYEQKVLKDSGKLNPIVNAWLNAAEYSLNNPLNVGGNFSEIGRFYKNDSTATSYLVDIKRGQKIIVSLNKLNNNFNVYMDLWEAGDTSIRKIPAFITASDTAFNTIEYAATKDEKLIIRFQQELSAQGDYAFDIKTGPVFSFPISPSVKSNIGSLWGDDRDAGVRKHEGIDIFAAKKSPAVAVADGIISSVSENELGGKVVFLRPANMNYNVYYAHLDSQLVEEGQRVVKGQTIGLVGNTGNARTTAAHLHFGIYTMSGAIDPLLFVKPVSYVKKVSTTFPLKNNFVAVRSAKLLTDITVKKAIEIILKNAPVKVHAVADNYYRVATANGKKGFILKADVKQL
ncbi:MAG: M23 family metallopeptidase [Ferruginibacter sp.]|nr:M23 family metallopeptidase [Ferruginibacter sp.]